MTSSHAEPAYVTVNEGVRVPAEQAPSTQRCSYCSQATDHDDIYSLHYRRADGVPGMSYPACGRCRPERVARLERLGFTMTAKPDDGPA